MLGLPFHYRDRRTEGMIAAAHAGGPSRCTREPASRRCRSTRSSSSSPRRAAGRVGRRADRADPGPVRPVADRRAPQRGDDRLDDRAARRGTPLGARPGRAARAAAPRSPARSSPGRPRPGARAITRPAGAPPGPVWTVAGHDTASAFVGRAAARTPRRGAVLGNLVAARRRDRRAAARCPSAEFNLTNERGIDGRSGSCATSWACGWCRSAAGPGSERGRTRLRRAPALAEAPPEVPLFDPDPTRCCTR